MLSLRCQWWLNGLFYRMISKIKWVVVAHNCKVQYKWSIIFLGILNVADQTLVVQRFRIRLLKQGTWVRPLFWEDPTCLGVKLSSVHYNYWCLPQRPAILSYWSPGAPRAPEPTSLATREATATRNPKTKIQRVAPTLCTRESLWQQVKTQHRQKLKFIFLMADPV